jgi:hypothetical protein
MPLEPEPVKQAHAHFLIAGLGAAFPMICQIIMVDKTNFLEVPAVTLLGFLLRVLGVFLVGGVFAHYVYWSERNPAKLFLAAMSAPALITAIGNGQSAANVNPSLTKSRAGAEISVRTRGTERKSSLFPWSWTVYAAQSGFKTLSLPEEPFGKQLWRGITGDAPKDVYFAMAGSYLTATWAQLAARRVQALPDLAAATVYAPSAGNQYYSVVIKPNVTMEVAQALARKAVDAGILDAYAWRYGDPGVLPTPQSWADQLGRTDYIDGTLGAGYAKSLSDAALQALIAGGKNSVAIIANILMDPSARLGRSESQLLKGLLEAVKELEAKGIPMPPNVNLQMARHFGDCSVVVPFLEKAQQADPNAMSSEPDLYCQLGGCYLKREVPKLEAARDSYQRCVDLRGDRATALDHRMYGRTLVNVGRKLKSEHPEESRAAYRQGLDEIIRARQLGDDPGRSKPEFDEATIALGSGR